MIIKEEKLSAKRNFIKIKRKYRNIDTNTIRIQKAVGYRYVCVYIQYKIENAT